MSPKMATGILRVSCRMRKGAHSDGSHTRASGAQASRMPARSAIWAGTDSKTHCRQVARKAKGLAVSDRIPRGDNTSSSISSSFNSRNGKHWKPAASTVARAWEPV